MKKGAVLPELTTPFAISGTVAGQTKDKIQIITVNIEPRQFFEFKKRISRPDQFNSIGMYFCVKRYSANKKVYQVAQ